MTTTTRGDSCLPKPNRAALSLISCNVIVIIIDFRSYITWEAPFKGFPSRYLICSLEKVFENGIPG
jgi:hypothetical protein